MKSVYLLFLTMLSTACFSQKTTVITVSFQKQIIESLITEDNRDKTVVLPSNIRSADVLYISNSNSEEEKQWKRSFEIFDTTDRSILKIQASSSPSKITGEQLKTLLKKGQSYSLYTMAIPADEKIAATVRVRRIFVCRINVK